MRRLLVLCGLCLPTAARADVKLTLVPELRLAAGYDDNLFLDANPTGTLPTQIRRDAIFDVEPRLLGRLEAKGHTFSLSLDYLERITISNQDLRDVSLRADWLSPALGPVRLLAGALFEHYEADEFFGDTFDLGGGGAALRASVRGRLLLDARYRFDARAYAHRAPSQLDLEHRVLGFAQVRLHRILDAELAYTFLHIDSTLARQQLDRHRGDLALALHPLSWLAARLAYGIAYERLPAGSVSGSARDDLLHELTLLVAARPVRWLEIFARYDLYLSTSADPLGNWRRNQVQAGVAFSWSFDRKWVHLPLWAPAIRGARVTFRFAGPAARVSVVGDWNGWDASAQPLARTGSHFEGTYTIPPGRREYALSVDGVVQPPPDAPGYVPDGFGGKNGFLEVP